MDRKDFIKKATMAAAGAAVVSPVSAMLDSVTSGKTCHETLLQTDMKLKIKKAVKTLEAKGYKILQKEK